MSDSGRFLLGKLGEMLAQDHLESLGYRILRRNFRTREGEIDIVAKEEDVLAFVEVRTRISDEFGHPVETVGTRKQTKLRHIAAQYLQAVGGRNSEIRFDVLGIIMSEGTRPEFTLIRDAFHFNRITPR